MSLRPTDLVTDPESQVAFLAVRLIALAETLGMLPKALERGVDREGIAAALNAFAGAGVGRRGAVLSGHVTPEHLADVLRDVLEAVEESPMPQHEWVPVAEVLGDDLVARLVGTSVSSVHRYRGGERSTPDDVAARLHTVALITADLAGSYNDFGIRRWFQRSRSGLDGASPADVLSGDWSPDDERVAGVRSLAGALLGSPATFREAGRLVSRLPGRSDTTASWWGNSPHREICGIARRRGTRAASRAWASGRSSCRRTDDRPVRRPTGPHQLARR